MCAHRFEHPISFPALGSSDVLAQQKRNILLRSSRKPSSQLISFLLRRFKNSFSKMSKNPRVSSSTCPVKRDSLTPVKGADLLPICSLVSEKKKEPSVGVNTLSCYDQSET